MTHLNGPVVMRCSDLSGTEPRIRCQPENHVRTVRSLFVRVALGDPKITRLAFDQKCVNVIRVKTTLRCAYEIQHVCLDAESIERSGKRQLMCLREPRIVALVRNEVNHGHATLSFGEVDSARNVGGLERSRPNGTSESVIRSTTYLRQ